MYTRDADWVEEYDFLTVLYPRQNELLSSWLTRMAHAHGMGLSQFISLFIRHNGSALARTDLDFKFFTDFLEVLVQKSGLIPAVISGLSLRSEEGYLYTCDNCFYPPKHVRKPIDKRSHYGLMYCPQCLEEDPHPYFRKQWRYLFYTACPKHSVLLSDRCWRCYAPIKLSKLTPADQLTTCHKCKQDLRLTKSKKIPEELHDGLDAIRWFEQGLNRGYFEVNNEKVNSLVIFHVYTILRSILKSNRNIQLPDFLHIKSYQKIIVNLNHYNSKKQEAIYRSFYLNDMVYFLLQNFPHNLSNFIDINHFTHRDFVHGFKNTPFWYQNILDEIVPMQNKVGRKISENEIISAIRYLQEKGIHVTQKNITKILCSNFAMHLKHRLLYTSLLNNV